MSEKQLRDENASRSVNEVGPGDYVKVGGVWEKITHNTAFGKEHQRSWTVQTEGGGDYGMYNIGRYAKAEDFKK